MATTRTPGITVDTEGFRTSNKEHRGERIFARLGLVCQEQVECRLAQELETLRPLIEARLADGVSATTINRTLEVARTILHRAARAYRDGDGFRWLETAPPLITMLRESPRPPHPINWDEQDRIFRRLTDHLGRMALFAVNTGLRDATYVAYSGHGRCRSPSSVAVCSSFRRKRSNRDARTW
jgi:hypothetical protein